MNKKIYLLVLLILLLGLFLSACTRSASKSPTDLSTPTSEIPFPIGTIDTSALITQISQGTQVSLGTLVPPQTTPLPGLTSAPQSTTAVQPVAATPTMPVIPTITRPESYTLQSGEWPLCIARRYNLDALAFLAVNGLTMDSQPGAGTVLIIPQDGEWTIGDRFLVPHPDEYIVDPGDTIYSVACYYGDVDPNAIIIANNLQSPYNLTVGDELRIP
jgi:hypothetical protein